MDALPVLNQLGLDNQALFETLLENTREGVCVLDQSGRLLLTNQRLQEWFQAKALPNQLEGLFQTSLGFSRLQQILQQEHRQRPPFTFELELALPEPRPVYGRMFKLQAEQPLWLLLLNDLRREKQLESTLADSQEQQMMLWQALPVPVAVVKISDGMILQGNEEFSVWYGLPLNSLTAVSITDFFARPADWLFLLAETRRQVGYLTREVPVRNPDQSVAWSRVSSQEIHFDGYPAIMLAFYDITQVKQIEKSLDWSNRLLRAMMTAQSQFVDNIDPETLFLHILDHFLSMTYSEFGFLVTFHPLNPEQLEVLSLNHTRWNIDMVENFVLSAKQVFLELYQQQHPLFEALHTPQSLYTTQQAGLPFPWLQDFVGIPLFSSGERVGMVGLGNVAYPFDETLHMELNPLLVTAGHIVAAWRNHWLRNRAEAELQQSHQELRHLHQDLRQLVDNASTPIFAVDLQGLITHWNKAAADLTGVSQEEVEMGMLIYQVLNPDSHAILANLLQQSESQIALSGVELNLLTQSKQDRAVLCSFTPRRRETGELMGVWCVGQDITFLTRYQHHLKQEVQTQTRKLENALFEQRQLSQQLKEALEKKQAADALSNRFAGLASHEFRGPLAAIQMAAENLFNHGDQMSPEKVKRKISRIKDRSEQLHYIVHDILLLIQLDAGRVIFHPEVVHIDELCEQIIEDIQHATGRTHTIHLDCPPLKMRFDKNLVRMMLSNLLHNAIKYSFEQKEIWLRIRVHKTHWLIEVEDRGIGITAEERPHIFEPFYRSKRVVSLTSGSGLGLELVNRALSLHQGKVEVITLERGSLFKLSLPYRKA